MANFDVKRDKSLQDVDWQKQLYSLQKVEKKKKQKTKRCVEQYLIFQRLNIGELGHWHGHFW